MSASAATRWARYSHGAGEWYQPQTGCSRRGRHRHRWRHARCPPASHCRILGHGVRPPSGRGRLGRYAQGTCRVVTGRHWRPYPCRDPEACGPALARGGRTAGRLPGQRELRFSGRLRSGLPSIGGPVYGSYVTFSYIAHFVEVHVEPTTRRVRVPRVVSVADCGRVMSPRTAASQVRGGVVWGIGATLRKRARSTLVTADSECGSRRIRFPVNADIGAIEVEFIPTSPILFSTVLGPRAWVKSP